ncbi:MAG: hypothetical protein KDJ29_01040 [Hyphomicrobiales bacterium]|nr:hypothetical protein [Hyphomicrobiales bacterium]
MRATIKNSLLSGTAAIALMCGAYMIPASAESGKPIQLAQGHSGGSQSSGGHNGGSRGGHAGAGASSNAGGPLSKGSAGSKGGSGTRGKPVWAQEGIPEVELGRLNVVRAPASVLDRQLKEALATWNPALAEPNNITIAQIYGMSVTQFIAYLKSVDFKEVTLIDSPLQNLALLKDLLSDGKTSLTGVTPYSTTQLAAIFIGVASDKTLPITTDTVIALTKILGVTVSDPAAVASLAESVRQAVLVAHG